MRKPMNFLLRLVAHLIPADYVAGLSSCPSGSISRVLDLIEERAAMRTKMIVEHNGEGKSTGKIVIQFLSPMC